MTLAAPAFVTTLGDADPWPRKYSVLVPATAMAFPVLVEYARLFPADTGIPRDPLRVARTWIKDEVIVSCQPLMGRACVHWPCRCPFEPPASYTGWVITPGGRMQFRRAGLIVAGAERWAT